jgi:hypothetical protein
MGEEEKASLGGMTFTWRDDLHSEEMTFTLNLNVLDLFS